MKTLVRLGLILIFLSSCASYMDSFTEIEKPIEYYTPEFLNGFEENSFKISIEAYGNHFGGILAVKKLDENHFRFAFLNEFGGKMLDFELIGQKLKLHYAVEALNKKTILRLLKKDFNLLFHENNPILNAFQSEPSLVLKAEINQKPVYYFLENNRLQKTISTGRNKEKTRLEYRYDSPEFPEVIISHQNLKIKIYLHLLNKK